ncbi:hypothetical protein MVEN_00971800 [Mycena venus]|uniref:Uncharacterized protein n=1 Tax=Mycena venus TaxID=2733690 RepID=A0A8H6YDA2_9AGAR|nr:hypothetical protein MVEN_00971800 [Mycena venus]
MLLDDVRGRPFGFVQTVRQAVLLPEVLKTVIKIVDPKLLEGDLDQVEPGFRYLVGHLWKLSGKDMDETIDWLEELLGPLIEIAIAAYDKPPKHSRKAKDEKASIDEEKKRNVAVGAALLFLKNLKTVQANEGNSDTSDSSFGDAANPSDSQVAESTDLPAATTARIFHFEGPKDEPAAIFDSDEHPAPDKLPGIFEQWRLLHVDRGHEWDAIDPEILKAASSWPPHPQDESNYDVPAFTEPDAASVTLVVGTTTSVTVSELDYENVFESFLRDDSDLYLPDTPHNSAPEDYSTPEDYGAPEDSGAFSPLPTTPKKSSKALELRSPLAPLNH